MITSEQGPGWLKITDTGNIPSDTVWWVEEYHESVTLTFMKGEAYHDTLKMHGTRDEMLKVIADIHNKLREGR